MIVYLCRHGRTHLNAQGRVRGHEDPPLDEVGRAEAAALGHHFATVTIDAVAATPLQRARDTAAAIAAPHGLAVRDAPDLMDRDYGPWAGTPTADVLAQFGSIDQARRRALGLLRPARDRRLPRRRRHVLPRRLPGRNFRRSPDRRP